MIKFNCLLSILIEISLQKPSLISNRDIWEDNIGKNVEEINNNLRYSRVLNFFPVPVEEECNSNDGRRKGVCLNTYECRIKGGKSYGFCALGFGVCCVFTSTCNEETSNNITYFVNPHFPDLTTGMSKCTLNLKKMDDEISQFRLDFIHFNLGQPNRKTGVCEEDIFLIRSGNVSKSLTMCGFNSGQHVYFDVGNTEDSIEIEMNLSNKTVLSRLWEITILQIPFTQRAPSGCLQYFQDDKGAIRTMNFADNGRHLAEQDYNICVRQNEGMCSIAYEPCDENSFKINPNLNDDEHLNLEESSGDGDNINAEQVEGRNIINIICNDRITLPCDSDHLLMMENEDSLMGFCDLNHCGSNLCPSGEMPCRLESSITPFTIGVHFGVHNSRDISPDDNLGMCLTYEQLPCNF